MSLSDPIADMLTRIRNGQKVALPSVTMPSSTQKEAIAKVLQDEGYIVGFQVADVGNNKRELSIELKYFDGRPVIDEIRRVSRCGCASIGARTRCRRFRAGWVSPLCRRRLA